MDPTRYLFLLLFFMRPWILCLTIGFLAGGVLTLEYPNVKAHMVTVQSWYQNILKPPIEDLIQNIRDAADATQ
jgi:hypothetical protein